MESASSTSAFVGRDLELATLAATVRDARAGRGGLLILVGPAGIGKTRLLEELCARRTAGRRVLWGRCTDDAGAPAYWPWVQVLRAWVEEASPEELETSLRDIAAEIARLVPRLRDIVGDLPPAPRLEPEEARFRLFDAIAVLLRRIGASNPLIVVLDDLQYADDDSLKLLAHLAQEIRTAAVVVIAACRDIGSRPAPAFLEAIRAGRRLPLGGLDLADVERWLRDRPDRATVEAAALHRATEGNPLFLEEMLRAGEAGDRGTRPAASATDLALPGEVRELLVRHLAPLSPDERNLLATAAVLGREFDLLALQITCALPGDQLLDRLDAAMRQALVEEVPGRIGRYRFRHAPVREALYADLGPAERAALHLAVARALEQQHATSADPPLDELAYHFHSGAPLGDAGKAIEYSVRAAQRASARFAYDDAVKHYQRAHDALALEAVDPTRHVHLLLGLAEAVWQTGDHARARLGYERAARAARALGDGVLHGAAALGFGRSTPDDGAVHPESIALLEEGLAALPEGDSPLRVFLLARLALALYFTRDRARIEDLSREAVECARRLGDPRALTSALLGRHLVLLGPDGSLAERLEVIDEALRLARETENLDLAQPAHAWRVVALLEMGDGPAARSELASFRRRWEESRLPVAMWHARAMAATGALVDGRYAEAALLAVEALSRRSLGVASAPAQYFATQLFEVRRQEDRLADQEAGIRALAEAFPAAHSWRCLLAEVWVETGRAAEARALVEPLVAPGLPAVARDGNYVAILASLAEIATALEDERWAEILYAGLAPLADRNVVMIYGSGFRGPVARYLGLLADRRGRTADAERHLEAALAMSQRMGARGFAAETRTDLARVLLRRATADDRQRAATLLEQARGMAAELAMTRVARVVERLSAELRDGAPGEPAVSPTARIVAGRGSPRATLRRDGDAWTIGYQNDSWRLADMKGLGYLARLIASPEVEIGVLDLVGAASIDEARKARAAQERARVNATRAIAAAIKRIAAISPRLGRHLDGAVRTGIACSYANDPDHPIEWAL